MVAVAAIAIVSIVTIAIVTIMEIRGRRLRLRLGVSVRLDDLMNRRRGIRRGRSEGEGKCEGTRRAGVLGGSAGVAVELRHIYDQLLLARLPACLLPCCLRMHRKT